MSTLFEQYEEQATQSQVVICDYENKQTIETNIDMSQLSRGTIRLSIASKLVIFGAGFFAAILELVRERFFNGHDAENNNMGRIYRRLLLDIKNLAYVRILPGAFRLGENDDNYTFYMEKFDPLEITFNTCKFDANVTLPSNLFGYLPNINCKFIYCTGMRLPPVEYDATEKTYDGGIAIGSGATFSIIRCDISEIPRYTLNRIDCDEIIISGCNQLRELPDDIFVGVLYTGRFDFSNNQILHLPSSICWPDYADQEENERALSRIEKDENRFDFSENAITFTDGTFEVVGSDIYKIVRMMLYSNLHRINKEIDVKSSAMHPAAFVFLAKMNTYFDTLEIEMEDSTAEEEEAEAEAEEFDWMSDMDEEEEGAMFRRGGLN